MKTKNLFLSLLVVFTIMLFSCESTKESNEDDLESTDISELIITADQQELTIAANETLRFNLELEDGDEASIIAAPNNALISRINPNGRYIYKPESDFTGTNNVLIRIESEPDTEEEGLVIIIGAVRYVYITIIIEDSEEVVIDEDTVLNITSGACGTLIFQDKIGDDYDSALVALEQIRESYLTSYCPDNPCFDSYLIENVEIETDFDLDEREFLGVKYIYVKDGIESSSVSLTDVLDTEGNYYAINWCLED